MSNIFEPIVVEEEAFESEFNKNEVEKFDVRFYMDSKATRTEELTLFISNFIINLIFVIYNKYLTKFKKYI